MCHTNNITKERKCKHLEYSERLSIERWWNRDKRTKVEIAELLDRTEKTIRNEIERGLVKNLTTELIEIWVYSADVAQQKYEYYLKAKGPKLKIDNDYELKEYIERSIKEDKKSPRTQVYYAHPYRSGERGSNENANRLIRRFIPKGIDITPISEEYIQKIEDWINNYQELCLIIKVPTKS